MTEIDIDALDGVELGKAVAVEVMGWFDAEANNGTPLRYPFITLRGDQLYVTAEHGPSREWHSWSDLRAAGEVLDKMTGEGYGYSVYGGSDDTGAVVHSVSLWHDDKKIRVVSDWLPSRPTAICRAALKAVREERVG